MNENGLCRSFYRSYFFLRESVAFWRFDDPSFKATRTEDVGTTTAFDERSFAVLAGCIRIGCFLLGACLDFPNGFEITVVLHSGSCRSSHRYRCVASATRVAFEGLPRHATKCQYHHQLANDGRLFLS